MPHGSFTQEIPMREKERESPAAFVVVITLLAAGFAYDRHIRHTYDDKGFTLLRRHDLIEAVKQYPDAAARAANQDGQVRTAFKRYYGEKDAARKLAKSYGLIDQ